MEQHNFTYTVTVSMLQCSPNVGLHIAMARIYQLCADGTHVFSFHCWIDSCHINILVLLTGLIHNVNYAVFNTYKQLRCTPTDKKQTALS